MTQHLAKPLTRFHDLAPILLIALVLGGCATTAPNRSLDAAYRNPVGARLVPQPLMPVDSELKLDLSAYYVNEPAQVEARLRIQPDSRVRSITIEWWSLEGAGGSHLISLEGDRSAATYRYPMKRIAEGEYMVTATLQRNDGTSVRRARRMYVIGEGRIMTTPGIAEDAPW